MKPTVTLFAAAGMAAATMTILATPAFAQVPASRTGPGVQAAQDVNAPAVLAQCKNGPPPPQQRPANAPPPATSPPPAREYKVNAIPGLIKGGLRWQLVWETTGNNGDGILATPDGGVMIAQNDKSQVLRISADGKASVAFTDTRTGGALTRSPDGKLYVNSRQLNPSITQLSPERRVFANRYNDEPFDCIGGVLNDLQADARGGIYFTYTGLFYADSNGKVTRYGENLRTNGIGLSPDGKVLYVTNGPSLAAFDVQPDGSLANQREHAKLEGGNGDGLTVDEKGRIWVTGGVGLWVVSPKGGVIGTLATPYNIISVAFGGPRRSTLFAVVQTPGGDARIDQVISIPTLTHGLPGRSK
jgi:sugar lactone lactonase YvrE